MFVSVINLLMIVIKKIVMMIIIAGVAILIGTSFAKPKNEYHFLNEQSKIVEMKIVHIGNYNKLSGDYEVREICEIEDFEKFFDELKKIECTAVFPREIPAFPENVIAIQIKYQNGDWEWISSENQARYWYGIGLDRYTSFYEFEQSQFNRVLDVYLKD